MPPLTRNVCQAEALLTSHECASGPIFDPQIPLRVTSIMPLIPNRRIHRSPYRLEKRKSRLRVGTHGAMGCTEAIMDLIG